MERYSAPKTKAELQRALQTMNDTTYICAGATDLMLKIRKMHRDSYSLLDLTYLEELKKVEKVKNSICIGSGVTMTELEENLNIQSFLPALAKAASLVGSTQIRNRATLGGNIANASQSADTVPVLMAYGAKLVLYDKSGCTRTVYLEDFITGRNETMLEQGEIIYRIEVPVCKGFSGFSKTGSRKAVTISKVSGCICFEYENKTLNHVRIYLGAVGTRALRAPHIEAVLKGRCWTDITLEQLKQGVYEQIEENIGDRSSKYYKKSAALGVILDILQDAKKEDE